MKISQFRLQNFRNIATWELTQVPQLLFFYGENGQGKTNLLEALYIALKGKSFRPHMNSEDWMGLGPMEVQCRIEDEQSYSSTHRVDGQIGSAVKFYRDEKKISKTLLAMTPIVVFSPDDHALIRSGPDVRRDFLDDVFSTIEASYAEDLTRFEKTLKQRNRLLKELKAMPQRDNEKLAELKSWTELLSVEAERISERRRTLWANFSQILQKTASELFLGTQVELSFKYLSDVCEAPTALNYLNAFWEAWEKDLATGWTHHGPQRDDFCPYINGLESRTTASQGQARLLALSLKWAHAHWVAQIRGEKPLFFVDDFSSELDLNRRHNLLQKIRDFGAQIFISSTEATALDFERDFYPSHESAYFEVSRGHFREKSPHGSSEKVIHDQAR